MRQSKPRGSGNRILEGGLGAPVETTGWDDTGWTLPSGQRITDFALEHVFLAPALMGPLTAGEELAVGSGAESGPK